MWIGRCRPKNYWWLCQFEISTWWVSFFYSESQTTKWLPEQQRPTLVVRFREVSSFSWAEYMCERIWKLTQVLASVVSPLFLSREPFIFYKLNELGPERWCWNLRVPMKKSGGLQMRPRGRKKIYGMCMVVLWWNLFCRHPDSLKKINDNDDDDNDNQ